MNYAIAALLFLSCCAAPPSEEPEADVPVEEFGHMVTTEDEPYWQARHYGLRVPVGLALLRECRNLKGVDLCFADHRYGLDVRRGKRFTWDEVEPLILELIEDAESDLEPPKT